MQSKTSSGWRVGVICGLMLGGVLAGRMGTVLAQPKEGRSQVQIHPAPLKQRSGNPMLEVPPAHRSEMPGLRAQPGANSNEHQIDRQNAVELPRVDQMSRKLLGCWTGDTEPSPAKWEIVSPRGKYLEYSRDTIHLCLIDANGKLEVRLADAKDAEAAAHAYRVMFRPVSALGKEVEMKVKSWDAESEADYLETGTARCVLNPDNTVSYSHSITTYLEGEPALNAEARATLRRDP